MIPADHISIEGDTAWWITDPGEWTDYGSILNELDRPCDTCGGNWQDYLEPLDRDGNVVSPCPDCDGTGRHVFDISVDRNAMPMRDGVHIGRDITLRVHVVPGMVLPIHDWCPDEKPADHICHAWKGGQQSEEWWQHRSFDHTDWTERQITLPPAAAPGMWAVQLKVAQ